MKMKCPNGHELHNMKMQYGCVAGNVVAFSVDDCLGGMMPEADTMMRTRGVANVHDRRDLRGLLSYFEFDWWCPQCWYCSKCKSLTLLVTDDYGTDRYDYKYSEMAELPKSFKGWSKYIFFLNEKDWRAFNDFCDGKTMEEAVGAYWGGDRAWISRDNKQIVVVDEQGKLKCGFELLNGEAKEDRDYQERDYEAFSDFNWLISDEERRKQIVVKFRLKFKMKRVGDEDLIPPVDCLEELVLDRRSSELYFCSNDKVDDSKAEFRIRSSDVDFLFSQVGYMFEVGGDELLVKTKDKTRAQLEMEFEFGDGRKEKCSGAMGIMGLAYECLCEEILKIAPCLEYAMSLGVKRWGWLNEELGRKKYCLVKIESLDRSYWYWTDSDLIEVGTTVTVPFGANNGMREGDVTEVAFLEPSLTPISDEKIKKIKDIIWKQVVY